MPNRRPTSKAVSIIAALAIASPLAVFAAVEVARSESASPKHVAFEAVPPQISEIPLASVPTIILNAVEAGLKQFGITLPPLPTDLLPPAPTGTTITTSPAPTTSANLPPIPGGSTTPAAPATSSDPTDTGTLPIKEVNSDSPFSMVALTWNGVLNTDIQLRAKQADGTWGPWYSAGPIATGKSDKPGFPTKTGSDPIFVGSTKSVQIAVVNHADTPGDGAPIPDVSALAKSLQAVLINPGSSPADGQLGDIAEPLAATTGGVPMPKVISRTQWGADESLRCDSPVDDGFIGGAVVHHTAGSNNYTPEESAEIVRSIYAYHAQTLGWCDIGYNALVDKYGQIFEGRAGGLDKAIEGAHAGGFNENTVGVAMMGDYTDVAPTDAELNSIGQFLGWRLHAQGLDPKGTTEMESEGTQYTFVPQGKSVSLPIIFGHRDVGLTECPGNTGYEYLGRIRDIAADYIAKGAAASSAAPTSSDLTTTSAPATTTSGSASAAPSGPTIGDLLAYFGAGDIAKKWISLGGNTSILGDPKTGEITGPSSSKHADFANGSLTWTPEGGTWFVIGAIYQAWQKLGGDFSGLGLPTSDEFPVPEGMQTNFQNGALLFDKLTGAVTQVAATYNDTYKKTYEEVMASSAAVSSSVPVPTPAAAPGS